MKKAKIDRKIKAKKMNRLEKDFMPLSGKIF
jgi:hypothetical protein